MSSDTGCYKHYCKRNAEFVNIFNEIFQYIKYISLCKKMFFPHHINEYMRLCYMV